MIDYQIFLERLSSSSTQDTHIVWETVMFVPFKKDGPIEETDVIKLKEQVAMQVIFGKTPARVRVAWTELTRCKIGGKHIENPREVCFFDSFTFTSAQHFLIIQLQSALDRVRLETP